MENLAKMIIRDGASNKFILSQTDLPDEGSEEVCAADGNITKDEHGAHAMQQKENKNDYRQKMSSNREKEDLNCITDRLD